MKEYPKAVLSKGSPIQTFAVTRIERPKKENGVIWPNIRIVVARFKSKEVQWHKAGTIYLYGELNTMPAELVLVDYNLFPDGIGKTLHTGGHLSNKLLKSYRQEINNFLELTVADMLHYSWTTIFQIKASFHAKNTIRR